MRFGNIGRNILRGPGAFNTDLGLSRDFPIKERLNLEFRTDCFNLTNTPKFPNPAANVSSPGSFMQITQHAEPPGWNSFKYRTPVPL